MTADNVGIGTQRGRFIPEDSAIAECHVTIDDCCLPIIECDGTIDECNGTIVFRRGTIVKHPGTMIECDGAIIKCDGTIIECTVRMIETSFRIIGCSFRIIEFPLSCAFVLGRRGHQTPCRSHATPVRRQEMTDYAAVRRGCLAGRRKMLSRNGRASILRQRGAYPHALQPPALRTHGDTRRGW